MTISSSVRGIGAGGVGAWDWVGGGDVTRRGTTPVLYWMLPECERVCVLGAVSGCKLDASYWEW